jgi:hypothetical protein
VSQADDTLRQPFGACGCACAPSGSVLYWGDNPCAAINDRRGIPLDFSNAHVLILLGALSAILNYRNKQKTA